MLAKLSLAQTSVMEEKKTFPAADFNMIIYLASFTISYFQFMLSLSKVFVYACVAA